MSNSCTFDDLEEAYAAAEQRNRLQAVYAFLKEHDASDELLDTIDEALVDLEMWLNDELRARAQPAVAWSPVRRSNVG